MDSRRAEFRRWIDYEGVLDAFSKLFVTMFEEEKWPEDPITYTRNFFGAVSKEEIQAALDENASLKKQVSDLEAQIQETVKKIEEGE